MSTCKAIWFVSFFLLMWSSTKAQDERNSSLDSLPFIVRDPRIDKLVHAHIRQNRASEGIEGYRVQVFSGSGNEARQQANSIRRQLLATNPDLPTHLVYQPPNFKVRVGDCRSEYDAIRIKRELSFHYPQGFAVRDVIKPPRLSIERVEMSVESGSPSPTE
jgi:hypothetical protein